MPPGPQRLLQVVDVVDQHGLGEHPGHGLPQLSVAGKTEVINMAAYRYSITCIQRLNIVLKAAVLQNNYTKKSLVTNISKYLFKFI